MRVELVVSPFGADGADMVDLARRAEDAGYDAVWTLDHLTGSMLGRGPGHDPFAVLGAMAAATDRIRIGPLVANVGNRHPVQLALAMATLQSISGGRAVLGVGAGAAPGSRWAVEHEAIGRILPPDGATRRRRLAETIRLLDVLWAGGDVFDGEFFSVDGIGDVVGPTRRPRIVVGAGSPATVQVAVEVADGVNLLPTPRLGAALDLIAAHADRDDFVVSLFADADLDHPDGGPLPDAVAERPGLVSARTLAVRAPFDVEAIAALAARRR